MRNKIFFTTHKAGSMALYTVLRDLCSETKLPLFSANEQTLSDDKVNLLNKNKEIEGKNGVFGPIRRPFKLNTPEKFDIFIHLRDPRDCLTSMFYSWVYSHVGIRDKSREKWKKDGVDAFVLQNSEDFMERLRLYSELYAQEENVIQMRYEEMVTDYSAWIRPIAQTFGVNLNSRIIKRLIKNQKKIVERVAKRGENKQEHVRSVIPGDYKMKLSRDTIDFLNESYADVVSGLGYKI